MSHSFPLSVSQGGHRRLLWPVRFAGGSGQAHQWQAPIAPTLMPQLNEPKHGSHEGSSGKRQSDTAPDLLRLCLAAVAPWQPALIEQSDADGPHGEQVRPPVLDGEDPSKHREE